MWNAAGDKAAWRDTESLSHSDGGVEPPEDTPEGMR